MLALLKLRVEDILVSAMFMHSAIGINIVSKIMDEIIAESLIHGGILGLKVLKTEEGLKMPKNVIILCNESTELRNLLDYKNLKLLMEWSELIFRTVWSNKS